MTRVSARLTGLREYWSESVLSGRMPGCAYLIGDANGVLDECYLGHLEVVGHTKRTDPDTLYPVYSMSKAITSLLALIYIDRGLCRLHDPISKWKPEYARPKIANASDLRRSAEEVTLLQLLTHTSGIGGAVHGSDTQNKWMERAGIVQFEHNSARDAYSLQEFLERMASIPLAASPGQQWQYGRSSDVLGGILEIIGDVKLDEALTKELLLPLGMNQTVFTVPERKVADVMIAPDKLNDSKLCIRPKFISGGSGLFSTIADYAKFCKAICGIGPEGKNIVSEELITSMSEDWIGRLAGTGPDYIPMEGFGFGLGLAVAIRGREKIAYWLGRGSTNFTVNLGSRSFAIFMTNAYGNARGFQKEFFNQVVSILTND